jgi:hypothetical protein
MNHSRARTGCAPTTWARTAGALVAGTALLLLTACGGQGSSAAGSGTASGPAVAVVTTPSPARTGDTGTTAPRHTTPTTTPPATSPTPTAGTPIAGEGLAADSAAALQAEVDAGHQPWRLDPAAVASAFVADRFGWRDARVALTGPDTAEVTGAGGRMLTLRLRQPVRPGQGGVWVVDSGTWRT